MPVNNLADLLASAVGNLPKRPTMYENLKRQERGMEPMTPQALQDFLDSLPPPTPNQDMPPSLPFVPPQRGLPPMPGSRDLTGPGTMPGPGELGPPRPPGQRPGITLPPRMLEPQAPRVLPPGVPPPPNLDRPRLPPMGIPGGKVERERLVPWRKEWEI